MTFPNPPVNCQGTRQLPLWRAGSGGRGGMPGRLLTLIEEEGNILESSDLDRRELVLVVGISKIRSERVVKWN